MVVRRSVVHPARIVPLAFLAAIAVGTALLSIPAVHPGGSTDWLVAAFTATSAVCVTGLIVVDTATYWSPIGQVLILVLIQAGGFGIMTLATVVSLVVSRRLGLRSRLTAQAETKTVGFGDVVAVLRRVAKTMLLVESLIGLILALRFWLHYDESIGRATWLGVFHSVSAFNNAGFSLFSTNLVDYATDFWICLPIAAAVILGGIGFPVLFELRRTRLRTDHWSIHTRLTIWTTLLLLVLGTVTMLAFEWSNPRTLGALDGPGKLLAAFFQGVQPRTAGFNSVDYAALTEETLTVQIGLMFVGGGSAGTAGGIKVTTFMLLGYVILAEIRGEHDVTIGNRRIAETVQRQAISVALIGVGAVASGTLALLATSEFPLGQVLFESASAFGTVGLSTGITAKLPDHAQVVLIVLMFVGRVGPVSAASFFALRDRHRLFRLPEARPIVG